MWEKLIGGDFMPCTSALRRGEAGAMYQMVAESGWSGGSVGPILRHSGRTEVADRLGCHGRVHGQDNQRQGPNGELGGQTVGGDRDATCHGNNGMRELAALRDALKRRRTRRDERFS